MTSSKLCVFAHFSFPLVCNGPRNKLCLPYDISKLHQHVIASYATSYVSIRKNNYFEILEVILKFSLFN